MNPKVDFYFIKAGIWQEEINKLRSIALDCGLDETLKWGVPCYTWEGNNIVLIHVFKEYCAYLFFKGALLKDPENLLIQQTKQVQAARQIRFTCVEEIEQLRSKLKTYIKEAIKTEKAGLKVKLKKTSEFPMPVEFKKILTENSKLKKAFEALTPGRQRGYLIYFDAAKQTKTRESRIEKYIPLILDGKGLHDG